MNKNKKSFYIVLICLFLVLFFRFCYPSTTNVDTVTNESTKVSTSIPIDTIEPPVIMDEGIVDETILETQDKAILGFDKPYFHYLTDDGISDEDKQILFKNYYQPSPKMFTAHGTLYGNEDSSYVELAFYGDVIRQQMWRGFVLTGSGMYGYQDVLGVFDNLLDKQGSEMYLYYADLIRDSANQPIPVSYEQLNGNQKRLYDITNFRSWEIADEFIVSTEVQSKQTETEALLSNKYIGFVSTKSPNDIGRRFLLYKGSDFAGIVLVTGCAKQADWTGVGLVTTETFRYYNNPLIVRISDDNSQWGFDFTNNLYSFFGGTGGATQPILAIDPDL